jgi:hypothetical protein
VKVRRYDGGVAKSFLMLMLLCGSAVLLAAVLASASLPQPWGRMAGLLAIAASILAWYRMDRPREIRAERLEKGQCLRCGYDLTGNVSGVCPECGRAQAHAAEGW